MSFLTQGPKRNFVVVFDPKNVPSGSKDVTSKGTRKSIGASSTGSSRRTSTTIRGIVGGSTTSRRS